MIKNFTPRLYQETILATCVDKNTLVVLPTGMGKTNIFLMLAAQRLQQYPQSKVLFIGPTRPLIEQYKKVFLEHFAIDEKLISIFTGMVTPAKRAELWKTSTVVFSTPQGLENDILSNRINLSDVSLLGIDEAHRATGDYAYVFVAQQYMKKARFPRILALTASPGSDVETIGEVAQNLSIEGIEVRTDADPDVKPYIQEVEVDWVKVELPKEFLEIQKLLKGFLEDRLGKLKSWGVLQRRNVSYVNKSDLIALQGQVRGKIASGEKDPIMWQSISVLAEIMKMQHALELLETQGIEALFQYLGRMNKEGGRSKVKAVQNIVKDLSFRSALIKTEKLVDEKVFHPKLIELGKIVSKEFKGNKNGKMIIFNNFRDNAAVVEREMNNLSGVRAKLFVGQTKKGDTGMSQKEQKKVIEEFGKGEYNVLVATSIGEEGLDIPKVDSVVFYEPVASAIRQIQRRGRTGRLDKGKVIILMAKGTRDEGYKWAAHHKEKRMFRTLDSLKDKLGTLLNGQKNRKLDSFVNTEKIKIYVDHREKGSGVIKALVDMDVEIQLEQLQKADFVLSKRVGVEFKTVHDFIESIIDGRLLVQIKDLKVGFERPIIIIEGQEDLYSVRNVHENAIRGMLGTIAVGYGIPVLRTKNPKDTAGLLYVIAKKEQEDKDSHFSPHGEKKEMSIKQWQEFIVSSLPGVGGTLAKPLLKKFKSIKKLINASEDRLQKVDKIGPTKARRIKEVVDGEYDG